MRPLRTLRTLRILATRPRDTRSYLTMAVWARQHSRRPFITSSRGQRRLNPSRRISELKEISNQSHKLIKMLKMTMMMRSASMRKALLTVGSRNLKVWLFVYDIFFAIDS
jgi:hypothetical protein